MYNINVGKVGLSCLFKSDTHPKYYVKSEYNIFQTTTNFTCITSVFTYRHFVKFYITIPSKLKKFKLETLPYTLEHSSVIFLLCVLILNRSSFRTHISLEWPLTTWFSTCVQCNQESTPTIITENNSYCLLFSKIANERKWMI